jgi:hypothetical protein
VNSQRSVPTPTCAADGCTSKKNATRTDADSLARYTDHLPFGLDTKRHPPNGSKLDPRSAGPLLYNAIKLGLIPQDFASHLVNVVAAIDRATQVCHPPAAAANVQPNMMNRAPWTTVRTGDPLRSCVLLRCAFRAFHLSPVFACGVCFPANSYPSELPVFHPAEYTPPGYVK